MALSLSMTNTVVMMKTDDSQSMASNSSDVFISGSNYNNSINAIDEDECITPDASLIDTTPRYITQPIVDKDGFNPHWVIAIFTISPHSMASPTRGISTHSS